MPRMYDVRMANGTRHFGAVPEIAGDGVDWATNVRDVVATLPGATLTAFVTDHVTEAWIDFDLAGHAFSINNQQGDWWFFVRDPACPDAVLARVLDHFEAALAPR